MRDSTARAWKMGVRSLTAVAWRLLAEPQACWPAGVPGAQGRAGSGGACADLMQPCLRLH